MARKTSGRKSNGRKFSTNPAYVKLLSNWRELVDKQTVAELELERALSRFPVRYRFQHLIWRYIVDFTVPDLKVAIEVDGDTHNSPEAKERDLERDTWLTKQGWRVYRFRNEDVLRNSRGCLKTIPELTAQEF